MREKLLSNHRFHDFREDRGDRNGTVVVRVCGVTSLGNGKHVGIFPRIRKHSALKELDKKTAKNWGQLGSTVFEDDRWDSIRTGWFGSV